jgi:hypothetical protein
MTNSSFRYGRSYLLGAIGVLLLAHVVFGQGMDQQLDKIAADWAKRQQQVKRVRYRVSGEVLVRRDSLTDDHGKPFQPAGEPTIKLPFKWTYLLDFQTNRHRLEIDQQMIHIPEVRPIRNASIVTFDGKNSWGSTLRDENLVRKPTDADIVISSGYFSKQYVEPSMFPAFYGHGIVPYAGSDRIYPARLKFEPNTDLLTVHGQVVHEGRPCLVLRTPPSEGTQTCYDELWVDPARDSAVVRHARYGGKTPITDLIIWYRETTHGWLPDHWQQTMHGEIKRARVDALEIDPTVANSDFRIAEEPGMLVTTGVYPGSGSEVLPPMTDVRNFRIDKDGKRREVVFEASTRGGENKVEKPVARTRWVWWAIGVAVVAVTLAGVYWVKRRRARRVGRLSEGARP